MQLNAIAENIPDYRGCAGMVCVTVFTHQKRDVWGMIQSPFIEKPITCTDGGDLLLKLDWLFDEIGTPMAFEKRRKFIDMSSPVEPYEITQFDSTERFNLYEVQRCSNDKTIEKRKKHHEDAGAFFLIHVLYRQHASMQGMVQWKGHNKFFRSALELLTLITSVTPDNSK